MSTPPLENIGGHPLVDFVNTRIQCELGKPVEFLNTFTDAKRWLENTQLITTDALTFQTDREVTTLKKIKTFRETMRRMFDHLIEHDAVPEEALTEINALLKKRKCESRVEWNGEKYVIQTKYYFTNPSCLMGVLAEVAADFLTQKNWLSLKCCQHEQCIRFFLDVSKNKSRRWCSMESCGNRIKAKRYYHQHKQKPQNVTS